ncbi:unnamed protein product [Polarella glacialis]|uniref:N-acetyltransferase domain-containing protein n=1 Tax=Polarella glacialis TaxID=89957 RepID=A0A813I7N7_POLGL|nr:unnamed protein product [Polarella glacialis]CAE8646650.1 unnamed protein product [Polarella glacialis]
MSALGARATEQVAGASWVAANSMELLGEADVAAMEQLIHGPGIGWEQTRDDLRRLAAAGAAVGIRAVPGQQGGQLLSMAALRVWPPTNEETASSWGWLSFVCTAPEARRRGYARTLVEFLLRRLPDDLPVGLYGGGVALDLYLSLGFRSIGRGRLWKRSPLGSGEGALTAADSGSTSRSPKVPEKLQDVPEALSFLDRTSDLQDWLRTGGSAWWLPETQSYLCARPIWNLESGGATNNNNNNNNKTNNNDVSKSSASGLWLGPVWASSTADAELLVRAFLSSPEAQEVRIMLLEPPAEVAPSPSTRDLDFWKRVGFQKVGTTELMVRSSGPSLPAPAELSLRSSFVSGHGLSIQLEAYAAAGFEYG